MPPVSDKERQKAVENAVSELIKALGHEISGELEATPSRVTELWLEHLLKGHETDLNALTLSTSPSDSQDYISLVDIGIHMVCPHHLTIGFGRAHVAYAPQGELTGFGSISELVSVCTQRLILQEDSASLIAQTLVNKIDALAAVAVLDATHPCHNVLHPRAHESRAISWARAGDEETAARLEATLRDTIQAG